MSEDDDSPAARLSIPLKIRSKAARKRASASGALTHSHFTLISFRFFLIRREFGTSVFRNPIPGTRVLRFLRGAAFSLYSNRGLKAALDNAFGTLTLGDIKAMKKQVLVTSFCVTSGSPRIFKTDHSADLTGDDRYLVRDVALASSAAPVYLPLIKIPAPGNGIESRYCDGGVFANHPALLGYAEAVSHLGCDPAAIKILSLSTPRTSLAERTSTRNPVTRFLLSRGVLLWGTKLAGVMIDSTSTIADQTLRRLMNWNAEMANTPPFRYVRVTLEQPPGTGLDIATSRATEALQQVGLEQARQTKVRKQIAHFFIN